MERLICGACALPFSLPRSPRAFSYRLSGKRFAQGVGIVFSFASLPQASWLSSPFASAWLAVCFPVRVTKLAYYWKKCPSGRKYFEAAIAGLILAAIAYIWLGFREVIWLAVAWVLMFFTYLKLGTKR